MLLHKRCNAARILLKIGRQHREALIAVLRVGGLNRRHPGAAGRAPGRPDIDQRTCSTLQIARCSPDSLLASGVQDGVFAPVS